MKTRVTGSSNVKSFHIIILVLTLIAAFAERGQSYQLQAFPDTLNLSARNGDTAVGYIRISDGRDSTAKPIRASLYVYGNQGCQVASLHLFYFAGNTYLTIVFGSTGEPESSGLLTLTTDSGSIDIILNGSTISGGAEFDLQQPISESPEFDSLQINEENCMDFQILNFTGGFNDSITITNITVTSWNQNDVPLNVKNAPSFPFDVQSEGGFGFQVCATPSDAKDSNWLLGTLTIDYSYHGSSLTYILPLYGFVTPPDTTCIAVIDGFVNAGYVVEGDTVVESTPLFNVTSSAVTIDSVRFVDGDTARFHYVSPSVPFTIPPNSIDSISIQYSVPSQASGPSYNATLELWPSGTSPQGYACGSYVASVGEDVKVLQCLTFSETNLPPIQEGASEMGYDTIFNPNDSDVTIDSIKITSGDTSDFNFQYPSFPAIVAGHSYLPLGFRLTAPTPCLQTSFYENMTIWDHGTRPDGLACNTLSGGQDGVLLIPYDTILLSLPPTASDTLRIEVKTAISGHLIVIQNSTADKIYLNDAEITDTTEIAFFSDYSGNDCYPSSAKAACFHDTLTPGEWSDTVLLIMEVPDSGTYPIDLTVNYVDGPQTQNYTILAHYLWPANAAVRIPLSTSITDFSLNPNPANSEVTISLPDGMNSTIEIYDVLGNLVLSKQASGSFVWNGQSSAGELVTDGAYIVRVREAQVSGQIATASKRLMFLR